MKVTWEVRRKLKYFGKWKTAYTYKGNMPQTVYETANKTMERKDRGLGKIFHWRVCRG